MIPYARQAIDDDDIAAVTAVLRSDFLTTGPEIDAFERELARECDAAHAVVVSSGTAALHCAYAACGLGPGDELITSSLTFSATANMALALGASVRFADVRDEDLCLDPELTLGKNTKIVAPVDFAGQPADIDRFMRLGVKVVEDASHAIGARIGERKVGSIAHATVLSFHPVKTITTGEGGAVLTNDAEIAARVRDFRNHGLVRDPQRLQSPEGPWSYEIQSLGFNYRLSALHAALGRSQLAKLDGFVVRRREIVSQYNAAFATLEGLTLPHARAGSTPAWHLYTIRCGSRRNEIAAALLARGVGTQVHYIPVNAMPLYRGSAATPIAARASAELLSLPLFPAMRDSEVEHVITSLRQVWGKKQ